MTDERFRSVSLLFLVNAAIKHQRFLALCAAVGLAFGLIAALLPPRRFSSTSSFVPQGQRSRPELEGMAAEFGINLTPAADVTQSPAFYVDLIKSRHILREAVRATYEVADEAIRTASLVEIFGYADDDSAKAEQRAIDQLRKTISVSATQRTNIVSIRVAAGSAKLAGAINQKLLDLVQEFNRTVRRSQATERRKFTEARLAEATKILRERESQLQTFLERNRRWQTSPELVIQNDRLTRDIAMQQSIYTTLAQSLEQAKIDEVRDTPVFTVIDEPSFPANADDPRIPTKAIIGTLVGLLLGVTTIFVWNTFADARHAGTPEIAEFNALTQSLRRRRQLSHIKTEFE